MDEYADIYYVDTRNAVRDHRPAGGAQGSSSPWRPGAPPPPRTAYVPPTAPPAYAQPGYAQPGYGQPQVIYAQPVPPYMVPQQSAFGSLFGRLTGGQVIEMVAQLFAALQPLPAAPVPQRSGDLDSGNNILFQDALAKHAKRDEQIRTLGSLVSRLIG